MQQTLNTIMTEPLERAYLVYGSETVWREAVFNALRDQMLREGFSDWNWSVFYGSKDLEAGAVIEELSTVPWGGGLKVVTITDAESVPIRYGNHCSMGTIKGTDQFLSSFLSQAG